jgi:hypothetical protein
MLYFKFFTCDPPCSDPDCPCKLRPPVATPPADATRRSIIFPDTKLPNDSSDVRNAYVYGEGKTLATYRELAEGTLRNAGIEFNADSFDRLSALTDDIRYRKELYEAFRLISLHDSLTVANENHEWVAGFLQFAIDNGAVADPPPDSGRSLHEYLQRVTTEIGALGERIMARESEKKADAGVGVGRWQQAGRDTNTAVATEKAAPVMNYLRQLIAAHPNEKDHWIAKLAFRKRPATVPHRTVRTLQDYVKAIRQEPRV